MSQPKRRAALLRGLASAVPLAAFGLASLPAHAQFLNNGWATPQSMLPTTAPGAPVFGGGGARPFAQSPGAPIMPGQAPWTAGAPLRSALPMYGANPFLGRSFPSAPQSPVQAMRTIPAFNEGVSGRQGGFYEADPSQSPRSVLAPDRRRPALVGADEPASSYRGVPRVPTIRPSRPLPIGLGAAAPPAPVAPANNFLYAPQYAPQASVAIVGGPALLGGYYYGGYCDTYYGSGTYPTVYSVYSVYDGFPQYIYSPGVAFQTLSSGPVYIAAPQPFTPPMYTVTYNQNNYYVVNETKAADIEAGGAPAKTAVHQAYPADTYQAAFADIQRAWTDGNLGLLKNHLHSDATKISVFLSSKYKYSLNSSDFAQITRDAFDRLDTVSFRFTSLRKAKNGDVTAYGKHVYRVTKASDTAAHKDGAASDKVVPFDASASPADGPADATDSAPSAEAGQEKTVYVAYTLRRGTDVWYIVSIDSSTDPLVKE